MKQFWFGVAAAALPSLALGLAAGQLFGVKSSHTHESDSPKIVRDAAETAVPDDITFEQPGKFWIPGDGWVTVNKAENGWSFVMLIDSGGYQYEGNLDPDGYRHGQWRYQSDLHHGGEVQVYYWHGEKLGTGDKALFEWGRRDNEAQLSR